MIYNEWENKRQECGRENWYSCYSRLQETFTVCPPPNAPVELEGDGPDDGDDTKLMLTLLAFAQSDGASNAGPSVNLTAAH